MRSSAMLIVVLTAVLLLVAGAGCSMSSGPRPVMPRIDGEWWQVAGNPDLGNLTGPPESNPNHPQEPVDFSIWQARDGTWQIWSCIRNTKCGGYTRLLYGWEGEKLTDTDWKPLGIVMQADHPRYEAHAGGLQAPHTLLIDDVYHMFYGDWDYICIQRGRDGKTFERWLYDNGKPWMFTHSKDGNTRDPCAIRIGDTWHVYYTCSTTPDGKREGGVYCRTSKDLRTWSEPTTVLSRGHIGGGPWDYECPHIVEIEGYFYLFCTQSYSYPATSCVYRSKNPMHFGIDDDSKFVCLIEVAAPELFKHEGQWHVAALMPDIQGIRIAKLAWVDDVVAHNH